MRAENTCKPSRKVLFILFDLKKKTGMSKKIWAKLPNIKFDENPITGPTVEQLCVGKSTERRCEGKRTLLKQTVWQ